MSSVAFAKAPVIAVKNALRDEFPEVGSSHMSEAFAAALGFRTNAAMLAALPMSNDDPDFILLDEDAFVSRLGALGYRVGSYYEFDLPNLAGVLNTTCNKAWSIEYRSARDRAWRNIIICAVNAGLERRLFSLRSNDNRWTDQSGRNAHQLDHDRGAVFTFALPNDMPAVAYVGDAGFGELAIHVAVNPTERGPDFVRTFNGGFAAGDAFAATWLERDRGAWIQSSTSSFKCRKNLLPTLTALSVRPAGYGDRGRVIL